MISVVTCDAVVKLMMSGDEAGVSGMEVVDV
jgi:hypothetical protein